MPADLAFLLIVALAGTWRAKYEKRRADQELAVERGRGKLGQRTTYD